MQCAVASGMVGYLAALCLFECQTTAGTSEVRAPTAAGWNLLSYLNIHHSKLNKIKSRIAMVACACWNNNRGPDAITNMFIQLELAIHIRIRPTRCGYGRQQDQAGAALHLPATVQWRSGTTRQ